MEIDDVLYCSRCGQQNRENNYQCTRCGFVLHAPSRPAVILTDDGSMGGLIPYKNTAALVAYYLAVFSLIPFFGIPMGIVAVFLGVKGLRYAEQHPEAKGRGHAWTGIVLGGLCALGYTLMSVAIAVACVSD